MEREDVYEAEKAVFGLMINKDNKIEFPDTRLPKSAKERIKWVFPAIDDGLRFYGALRFVLGLDEEADKREWEMGASYDWLPVSPEFKLWRDQTGVLPDMRIAVELIYGHEVSDEFNNEQVNA